MGDQKVDFFYRENEAAERIGATIAAALDGKPAAEVVPLRGLGSRGFLLWAMRLLLPKSSASGDPQRHHAQSEQ